MPRRPRRAASRREQLDGDLVELLVHNRVTSKVRHGWSDAWPAGESPFDPGAVLRGWMRHRAALVDFYGADRSAFRRRERELRDAAAAAAPITSNPAGESPDHPQENA